MEELRKAMTSFGFMIIQTLVTDIEPDMKVRAAMNEINAAQRLRWATSKTSCSLDCLVAATVYLLCTFLLFSDGAWEACRKTKASCGVKGWKTVMSLCVLNTQDSATCSKQIPFVCRVAAIEKAEAEKVQVVKGAEADAGLLLFPMLQYKTGCPECSTYRHPLLPRWLSEQ